MHAVAQQMALQIQADNAGFFFMAAEAMATQVTAHATMLPLTGAPGAIVAPGAPLPLWALGGQGGFVYTTLAAELRVAVPRVAPRIAAARAAMTAAAVAAGANGAARPRGAWFHVAEAAFMWVTLAASPFQPTAADVAALAGAAPAARAAAGWVLVRS